MKYVVRGASIVTIGLKNRPGPVDTNKGVPVLIQGVTPGLGEDIYSPVEGPKALEGRRATTVRAGRRAAQAEGDRVVLSAGARLTPEQENVVAQLAEIDRRVRAHEQAHLAAAGGYARGAPTYSYVTGPDGKLYAVGGEVSIDSSHVPGNPEATIEKARVVEAAASAPADPSSQDRQVAAAAAQMETNARLELAAMQARRLSSYQQGSEKKPSTASLLPVNLLA